MRRRYLNAHAECLDPTQIVDFEFVEDGCNRKSSACRCA